MLGSPDQNSMVKRRNRTLLDMVRNMLSNFKLPKSMWTEVPKMAMTEVLKMAMYISN